MTNHDGSKLPDLRYRRRSCDAGGLRIYVRNLLQLCYTVRYLRGRASIKTVSVALASQYHSRLISILTPALPCYSLLCLEMPSAERKPKTLYDKVFEAHIVDERPDGTILLYIGP